MEKDLINQIEEYDNTEIDEIDIPSEDIEEETSMEGIIYEVTVEPEEEFTIDISESMGWVSGDNRYHDSLLGIDFPNQHPITAIGGLREELDEIERLKTIYADKPNVANYYEWKDGAYDIYGYFVSLVPGTSKIKICEGSDIFGVSVDSAGFIGGQDATVPRDNSYGLIATSGLVDVRCELGVEVGDYVTANTRGYARKSDSSHGYKVLAKANKGGVEYAVIALGVQADVTDALGKGLDDLEGRVDVNEKNIVSAINVANQAYNKAESAASSASVSKDAIEEALKDILGFGEKLDDIDRSVISSSLIATQAKAIAESAATSAEAMRKEAVEEANKAMQDTIKLREDFEETARDMQESLDEAALKLGNAVDDLKDTTDDLKDQLDDTSAKIVGSMTALQGVCDDLQGQINDADTKLNDAKKELKGTIGEMQKSINGTSEKFLKLSEAIDPLITWPEGADSESATGVAGFVKQAYDNSILLGTIATWKDGDGPDSLAGYIQEAGKGYATTEQLSKVDETVASVKTMAETNKGSIEAITGVNGSLAGLRAQVDKNTASVSTLASNIVGLNLVLDYDTPQTSTAYYLCSYRISPSASDNTWTYNKRQVGYLVPYKQYTLRIDLTTDSTISQIGLYHGDGNTPLFGNKNGTTLSSWITIPEEGQGKEHYILTKTFYCSSAYTPTEDNYARIVIYHRCDSTSNTTNGKATTIHRIKIEEGNMATEWSSSLQSSIDSIAGVKATADANKATLDAMASYEKKDAHGNPIYSKAGIMAYVDENTAELYNLATYDFTDENNKPVEGAAGVIAQVDRNKSAISAIASRDFTKDGKTIRGLAGLDAYVDENESRVSQLASRVSGKYVVISAPSAKTEDWDEKRIYYWYDLDDKLDYKCYYYYDNGWKNGGHYFDEDFSTTGVLEFDTVYYVTDTKKYWYYQASETEEESGKWVSTTDAYTAGLTAAIAGLQAVTDDHSSQLSVVASYSKDGKTGLAGLVASVNQNGAKLSTLAEYTNKTTGGTNISGLLADVNANSANVAVVAKKSDDNYEAITGVKGTADANKAELDTIANYTCGTNYLPKTYGSESGREHYGITYTVDDKGWVTANGTATEDSCFYITNGYIDVPENIWLKISGCPSGGKVGEEERYILYAANDSGYGYYDYGEGIRMQTVKGKYTARIYIKKGQTVEDLVFKPRIESIESEGLAAIQQRADGNSAELSVVAHYNKDGKTGLAGLSAYVDANTSEVNALARHTFEGGAGAAGVVAQVTANQSSIANIATKEFKTDNGVGYTIAGMKAQVDEHGGQLDTIVDYTSGTDYTPTSYANADGWVHNGITYTVDEDGNITANGKATGDSRFTIVSTASPISIPRDAKFLVKGCPPGGRTWNETKKEYDNHYYLYVDGNTVCYEFGEGRTFISTLDAEKPASYHMWITIKAGVTANNLVFKPRVETVEQEGMAAIRQRADQSSSSINSLAFWQGKANTSMARIEQKADANGASINSTVINLHKYSVGPYSQALNFTLAQMEDVFEGEIIYAPTVSHEEEYKYTNEPIEVDTWNTSDKKVGQVYYDKKNEKYHYYYQRAWKDADKLDDIPIYTRTFTPGYLYKWRASSPYPYAWHTVDKNHDGLTPTQESASGDNTSSVNTSSMAVYFSTTEIVMGSDNKYGYWYTNGDTITDISGNTGTYKSYTLYKWDSYKDESGSTQDHWVAVATLAGNSQSRAVSQIRQDANSIALEVTNIAGSAATSKNWIDSNSANIQAVVSWKGKNADSIATFMSTASDNFASTSQVAQIVDEDGNIKAASIVSAVNESGSSVAIDADHILFTSTADYTALSENITLKGNQINFSAGDVGGRNLLKDTNISKTANASAQYSRKYTDYYTASGPLPDKPYTLSADVEILKCPEGEESPASITVNLYNVGDKNWGGATTMAINNNHAVGYITKVYREDVTRVLLYAEAGYSIKFSNVKLEEGRTPTAWSPAPEDNVLAEQTSSVMKWKMLPTGCYWWNDLAGTNSMENPLMRLTGGTNGGLYVKGHVEATSGYIGDSSSGWQINSNSITNGALGTNNSIWLVANGNTATSVSIGNSGSLNTWRIAVGENLGVTNEGILYAKGVSIQGDFEANSLHANRSISIGENTNIAAQKIVGGEVEAVPDVTTFYNAKKTIRALSSGLYRIQYELDALPTLTVTLPAKCHEDTIFNYQTEIIVEVIKYDSAHQQVLWNETGSIKNSGIITILADNETANITFGKSQTSTSDAYTEQVYTDWNNSDLSINYRCNVTLTGSNLDSSGKIWTEMQYNQPGLTITGDLTAVKANKYDLGSNVAPWKDVYTYNVCTSTINEGEGYYNTKLTSRRLFFSYSDKPNKDFSYPGYLSCNSDAVKLWGTWQTSAGIAVTSSRNQKFDIEILDARYSTLFDELKPSRFKYKDGTSGRYHLGYVLDELKDAMDISNIDTQELGAYCISDPSTGDGGIRYEEIIPLNTMQIQKLKPRVTTLEEKIQELEEKIRVLEAKNQEIEDDIQITEESAEQENVQEGIESEEIIQMPETDTIQE